jgi:uncharacterized protein YcnI
MTRTTTIAAMLALSATLAVPSAAGAHVTLQPPEAPAGGFVRLDVRVPSERDDAPTRRVVVRMPAGFAAARYEPVPGWRTTVAMRKLATPVTSEGETQTEEVDTITFAAARGADGIEPGQFQDFGISVRMPERAAGTKLTFKALQTYAGGEVVRWIGAPDADEPAPQVTLTAAADDAAAHGDQAPEPQQATAASGTAGDDEPQDGDRLALAALVVGGLGLLAALVALVGARRRQPRA